MNHRTAKSLALVLLSLPLVACGGGGDDDSATADEPSPWAGHTYFLNIPQRNWASPRGIGKDLYGVAPAFILQVSGTKKNTQVTLGVAPGTMTDANKMIVMLTADQTSQDTCGPTTAIPFSSESYPSSTIGPAQIKMHVLNAMAMPAPLQVTGDVYDFKLTDVLPNGSTPSTTGKLEATMDFKQLYILFGALGDSRDWMSVCSALHDAYSTDTVDVSCQPCPNGGSDPSCLSVSAEGIGAVEAPSLSVTPVDAATRPASCADSML